MKNAVRTFFSVGYSTISRAIHFGSIVFLCALVISPAVSSAEQGEGDETYGQEYSSNLINIRNSNGKLYAYIVLLFNENPHFVNLIQEDSIPLKLMQTDDFNVKSYKNYLTSLKTLPSFQMASTMLDVYLNPSHYSRKELDEIEKSFESRNVIFRISSTLTPAGRASLDYCIFGQKTLVNIKHPLFDVNEKIYNIRPLIYYDEFSTSNSTFYFDMIYINPDEVQNDFIIAQNVLLNKNVDTMFFVGARITEDIKACLRKAFSSPAAIRLEIWKMFEIHELTHKVLNNHYNFYEQVTGEELALSSTIYSNPYLGLAVMYSYLDYNAMNPHRIAALNYLRFVAQETGNKKIIDDPSLIRTLPEQEILRLTKLHFNSLKRILK
ncbi:MAG TPA: hypothetical protein VF857_07170 [Spirochaetota bacterium]